MVEPSVARIAQVASELISFPSVAGAEIPVVCHVERLLSELGWVTQRWSVPGDERFNIFATPSAVSPRILFTTHLDVVPADESLFRAVVRDNTLIGRGACDAKGIAATMIEAADSLRREGREDIGLLFVVGEETTGIGAQSAVQAIRKLGVSFIINGEPTENKLISAQKGVFTGSIQVEGRASHSGYPDIGVDANGFILELAQRLRQIDFGSHDRYGKATLNIGTIKGGWAPNIISPHAELSFFVRAVTEVAPLRGLFERVIDEVAASFPGARATLSLFGVDDPVELETISDMPTAVFCGGSDVSSLRHTGARCLMLGPGSLLNAHTDHESVGLDEIEAAFHLYRKLYLALS